jgi:CheY-like chemotaxis protein/anti-sigma regulatory factor (Ser/Thr protein kinase)
MDTTTKKRVIVIDDEELVRATLVAVLEGNGYAVEEADTGGKGLTRIKANRPDLILCDVNMPGMDGYQLLQELQSDPETATIPFLFLTGYADRDHFRHGMTLGADDYLTKPISQTELLTTLNKRLWKHSTIKAESERKLDELRANISRALPNELRTPLAGIISFCDRLIKEHETLPAAEVSDLVNRIHLFAGRLQRQVENFVIYAQLEVIASDERQVAELRALQAPDVLGLTELVVRQRGEHYSRLNDITFHGATAKVAMAEFPLARMVEELVDNAFKFSDRGSPVMVSVEPDAEQCAFTVHDRGRGMTEDQVGALGAYMQFNRKVQERQGAGLGLTIARRLTELHGGEFTVKSSPQDGTTVRVVLPLAR